MSIKTKRKPGPGLYLMPMAAALPIVAVVALAVSRIWPTLHKLLSIMIKLVVKG